MNRTRAQLSALTWHRVVSSNIARVAFEPGESGSLYVQFTNGTIGHYADCAVEHLDALLEASSDPAGSPGKTLNTRIKPDHAYERVVITPKGEQARDQDTRT